MFVVNSAEHDQTLHSEVYDLVLHCLPMSNKKVAISKWVKPVNIVFFRKGKARRG